MRKLIYIIAILLIASCTDKETAEPTTNVVIFSSAGVYEVRGEIGTFEVFPSSQNAFPSCGVVNYYGCGYYATYLPVGRYKIDYTSKRYSGTATLVVREGCNQYDLYTIHRWGEK